MSIKLLTKRHLDFLSLKGGYTGSFESTLVKIPHCWKSHVAAKFYFSDTSSQLEGFQLYYLDTDGVTEVPLYTDPGFSYGDTGDGLYTIPVDPVITTSSLIIRRPVYITLCEVEVYGGKNHNALAVNDTLLVYL